MSNNSSKIMLILNSVTDNTFGVIAKDKEILDFSFVESGSLFSAKGMSLIEKVLSETNISLSEINAVGFVNGPGSFTGIRVGLSFLKGMFFESNLPFAVFSSLFAQIFTGYCNNKHVVSLIKASGKSYYKAVYGASKETIAKPLKIKYNDLSSLVNGADCLVADCSDIKKIIESSNEKIDYKILCKEDIVKSTVNAAYYLYEKNMTTSVDKIVPLYLERSYAEKKKNINFSNHSKRQYPE